MGLDLRHRRPVGGTAVELAAGAAMYGKGGYADVLQALCNFLNVLCARQNSDPVPTFLAMPFCKVANVTQGIFGKSRAI